VEASEIAQYADSVMFCLSKGLCAPVGSILAGSKAFIEAARRKRKILGGGMRQVGMLAQAGIIALEKMTGRVHEDHEQALYLADLLGAIPGIEVYRDDIHINMVFFKINKPVDPEELTDALKKEGILVNPPEKGLMRLVTHYYIGKEQVEKTAAKFKDILG
jgi:threonine aldolase